MDSSIKLDLCFQSAKYTIQEFCLVGLIIYEYKDEFVII